MHSLNYSFPLALVMTLMLSHTTFATTNPLYNVCLGDNNYTSDDAFSNNLYQLLFELATRAPSAEGFALDTVGSHGLDSRVNGLALCQGDVNSSVCTSCIRTANANIKQLCPHSKEAIIWFDECMLHYSNTNFFGTIDAARLITVNVNNVSNPMVFDGKVKEMMSELKVKAGASPLLFASDVVVMSGSSEKLYGLVQCTRDLSSGECMECLESAIGVLPGGKEGARVWGGSCGIRYELYPFFNV